MAIFSRYRSAPVLGLGRQYGTSKSISIIRSGITSGLIPLVDVVTSTGNQRLDQLAAFYYKDARFWWILAAASDIGWGLQIPPGTVISIPDINAVANLIG